MKNTMKKRLKRWAPAALAASMMMIPAVSSLAAEEMPVFPFYPPAGFMFGSATPSDWVTAPLFGDNSLIWDGAQNNSTDFAGAGKEYAQTDITGEEYVVQAEEDNIDNTAAYESNIESAVEDESSTQITAESENDTEFSAEDEGTTEAILGEEDEYVYDDEGNQYYAKLLVYDFANTVPSDELLAGYIDQLFCPEEEDPFFNNYWRSTLGGDEAEFYDAVKEFTEEIAAGDEEYPVFDVQNAAPTVRLSKGQLGLPEDATNEEWYEAALNYYLRNRINVNRVMNSVYRDCPFDLYWAAGSYVVSFTAFIDEDDCVIDMPLIYFPAGSEWQGDYADDLGNYRIYNVQNDEILRAVYAAQNAWEIVEDHSWEDEAELLSSFEEEITRLAAAEYDPSASESDEDDYYLWQVVYVFDRDPGTTAAREGYERAFQCLCEMAGIESAYTDTVS